MKLSGLTIKNFGCFDDAGCEIKIDNIVVLIGQNNTGKSTILDAYEAFASAGGELKISNFYDENTKIPIEITGFFTDITAEDIKTVGKKCVYTDETFGECIKVMYKWSEDSKNGEKFEGEKYTFNSELGTFEKGGSGGFDSLLASRIPVPLRIKPTDTPEKIETTITEILTATIKTSIKKDKSKVAELLEQLEKLTNDFAAEVDGQLKETTDNISLKLKDIFPNYTAQFKPALGKVEVEKIIANGSHIRIKETDKDSLPLSHQGAGMQRSFLWAAISALAELGRIKKGTKKIEIDKPRILLIDEPESFLHPPTIRAAREALYKLAELENWQVMTSTHSPVFIDVSKPHTTIIRVEKSDSWSIKLISTDKISFEEEERIALSMIRSCNPMVNEFFFADKVLLVEGETEHLVYSALLQESEYKDKIHIVSCFGKGNIPLFAKILNHFGISYFAIHDSDNPKTKRKDKWITNAMWTVNKRICDEVSKSTNGAVTIVQVPYFEKFYFNEEIKGDKPYFAHTLINSKEFKSEDKYKPLREFYKAISDKTHDGIYKDIKELQSKVKAFVAIENPEPVEMWTFDGDE